jgi:CheY-like chemotaxis protein
MTSILVIEDDPDICDLLAGVMEAEFSAAVRCARTGKKALEAIETGVFDLAIIDVRMPEISGYELARRAAARNIPLLLSSGYPETDVTLKESECPYLAKPFLISELLYEAANAITQAAENIRLVKASLSRLAATGADLVAKPAVERSADERDARTQPVLKAFSSAAKDAIASDTIVEWLANLSPRLQG